MLWLLNLETCALEIVYGGLEAAPPYAILSHTWGAPEDEFLFQDWTSDLQNELKEALSPNTTTSFQPARAARGYASRKLVGFCLFARSFGLKYGWIDTLCIDKRSSAELAEAINSMWSYYKASKICIVYLWDMDPSHSALLQDNDGKEPDNSADQKWPYTWFERGWTLQELLAPKDVLFFDRDWGYAGTRTTLSTQISATTGILELILTRGFSGDLGLKTGSFNPGVCVAERLSWASARKTTRGEDRAYSLMGLFGVNMPILYGEGYENAFYRLQVEIFLATGDYSILAWGPRIKDEYRDPKDLNERLHNGWGDANSLFAPNMESFAHSKEDHRRLTYHYQKFWDEISVRPLDRGIVTHASGLRLQLAMTPITGATSGYGSDRRRYYRAYLPVAAVTEDETTYFLQNGRDYGHDFPVMSIVLDAGFENHANFTRCHDIGWQIHSLPDFKEALPAMEIRDVYVASRLIPSKEDIRNPPHYFCTWSFQIFDSEPGSFRVWPFKLLGDGGNGEWEGNEQEEGDEWQTPSPFLKLLDEIKPSSTSTDLFTGKSGTDTPQTGFYGFGREPTSGYCMRVVLLTVVDPWDGTCSVMMDVSGDVTESQDEVNVMAPYLDRGVIDTLAFWGARYVGDGEQENVERMSGFSAKMTVGDKIRVLRHPSVTCAVTTECAVENGGLNCNITVGTKPA